jgi:hypothetical protein
MANMTWVDDGCTQSMMKECEGYAAVKIPKVNSAVTRE